jgi:hypothetical protein
VEQDDPGIDSRSDTIHDDGSDRLGGGVLLPVARIDVPRHVGVSELGERGADLGSIGPVAERAPVPRTRIDAGNALDPPFGLPDVGSEAFRRQ